MTKTADISFEDAVKSAFPNAEIEERGYLFGDGDGAKRFRVVDGAMVLSDWKLEKLDAWRAACFRVSIISARNYK